MRADEEGGGVECWSYRLPCRARMTSKDSLCASEQHSTCNGEWEEGLGMERRGHGAAMHSQHIDMAGKNGGIGSLGKILAVM